MFGLGQFSLQLWSLIIVLGSASCKDRMTLRYTRSPSPDPDANPQFVLPHSSLAPVHQATSTAYAPPVHHAPPVNEAALRPYQYEYGVSDQYSGTQFSQKQSQDTAGVVLGMIMII